MRCCPGFIQADATRFYLEEKMDILFSDAVLHWIDAEKQPELLGNVAKALRVIGGLMGLKCSSNSPLREYLKIWPKKL